MLFIGDTAGDNAGVDCPTKMVGVVELLLLLGVVMVWLLEAAGAKLTAAALFRGLDTAVAFPLSSKSRVNGPDARSPNPSWAAVSPVNWNDDALELPS
jgi:hypothetical protein